MKRGGALLAALALPTVLRRAARATDSVGIEMIGKPDDIEMIGKPDGSEVWFEPIGLLIDPGRTVTWTNRDEGNSHTTTAYHPTISGRSQRIPMNAKPWHSDYLMPGGAFSVTFTEPGVYDYYCVPHEQAGMVGRIVVGEPPKDGWWRTPLLAKDPNLPEVALQTFPAIDDVIRKRIVRRG
jgi:plastocyanin